MIKKLKRGFTIVELIIVIAIIAILAAVLIPTFSGVFQNAQISADTQIAAGINSVLSAEEAFYGEPSDMNDVVKTLNQNGYDLLSLQPECSGNRFVWEKNSNQILYLDENGEVIFSSKQYDKSNCEIWEFTETLTQEMLDDGNNYYLTESVTLLSALTVKNGLCVASGKALYATSVCVESSATLIGSVDNVYYTLTLGENTVAEVFENDKIEGERLFIKSGATVKISSSQTLYGVLVNGESLAQTNGEFLFTMPYSHVVVEGNFINPDEGEDGGDNGNPDADDEKEEPKTYTLTYRFEKVTEDNRGFTLSDGKTTSSTYLNGELPVSEDTEIIAYIKSNSCVVQVNGITYTFSARISGGDKLPVTVTVNGEEIIKTEENPQTFKVNSNVEIVIKY